MEIVNSVPLTQETTVSEQRVYRLGDTIRLEHVVTRSTAPAQYRCSWIYRADAVSNGSSPESPEHLGFRVEDAVDHEAPEITDVRLS